MGRRDNWTKEDWREYYKQMAPLAKLAHQQMERAQTETLLLSMALDEETVKIHNEVAGMQAEALAMAEAVREERGNSPPNHRFRNLVIGIAVVALVAFLMWKLVG